MSVTGFKESFDVEVAERFLKYCLLTYKEIVFFCTNGYFEANNFFQLAQLVKNLDISVLMQSLK